MTRRHDAQKFTIAHLRATAEKLKNWGRWGPDDQVGTLNFVAPQDTFEWRVRLFLRYDSIQRNLFELPHEGLAFGIDGFWRFDVKLFGPVQL